MAVEQENKQDLYVAGGEIKTLTENMDYGTITVAEGGTLIVGEGCSITADQISNSGTLTTLKNSHVLTEALTLNSGDVTAYLDSFYAGQISVEGGINSVDGVIHSIGFQTTNTFYTVAGSVITTSRYQLDEFFLRQSIYSDGTVVITDGMDQEQVLKIIQYNNLRKVKVNGVTGFNKVTFLDNQVLEFSTINSFAGTSGNDTITIGKSAIITLGGDVVLGDRTNKFTVKQNARGQVVGTLKDVTQLKVENGVGVSGGNGNYQKYTEAYFGAIVLSKANSSITVGKFAYLNVDGENGSGDITGYDWKNQITVGANSRMEVKGDVTNITTLKVTSGAQFKSYSKQSSSEQGISSLSIGKELTGTKSNDTINIGNYTDVQIGSISTDYGKDKISVGKYAAFKAGAIDLGDSANKISTGDYTSFEAGQIKLGSTVEKSTLTFGKYSSVAIAGVSGVYTLKTGCGTNTAYASFASSGAVTGTDFKDQFTFGDYSHVSFGSFAAYEGDDKLTIGKYSTFTSGTMNFGDGKNTLSLGKGSSAVISGDVKGVCQLSLPAGNSTQSVSFCVSGNMSGTDENDKFTVGKYASLNVGGLCDFGDGKDTLTVDSYATVVLKSTREQCASINKFTIAKNAIAYLSTELRDKVNSKQDGIVVDIGVFDTTAVNFTSIEDERSDNDLLHCRSLSGTYNGWLKSTGVEDYEKDESDFFARDEINTVSLTPSVGSSLMVVLYGEDGNAETISSGLDHIDLAKYDNDESKARICAFEVCYQLPTYQHEAASYTLASLN